MFGFLLIQHNTRLIIASPRNHPRYTLVVGMLTREEYAIFAEYHQSPWFDRHISTNVKVLSAIGVLQANVSCHLDIAYEMSRGTISHMPCKECGGPTGSIHLIC